jgi:hypothetical protein
MDEKSPDKLGFKAIAAADEQAAQIRSVWPTFPLNVWSHVSQTSPPIPSVFGGFFIAVLGALSQIGTAV